MDQFRNLIVNGNFDIWRRGTIERSTFTRIADRFTGQSVKDAAYSKSVEIPFGTGHSFKIESLYNNNFCGLHCEYLPSDFKDFANRKGCLMFWVKSDVHRDVSINIDLRGRCGPLGLDPKLHFTETIKPGTWTPVVIPLEMGKYEHGLDMSFTTNLNAGDEIKFSKMMLLVPVRDAAFEDVIEEDGSFQFYVRAKSDFISELNDCDRYYSTTYPAGCTHRSRCLHEYKTVERGKTYTHELSYDMVGVPYVEVMCAESGNEIGLESMNATKNLITFTISKKSEKREYKVHLILTCNGPYG